VNTSTARTDVRIASYGLLPTVPTEYWFVGVRLLGRSVHEKHADRETRVCKEMKRADLQLRGIVEIDRRWKWRLHCEIVRQVRKLNHERVRMENHDQVRDREY
jgi:hypothetical protein